ncbi:tubulointerstitial nephritis antigen-like isoform X3 [Balaenoptera musculus]|uniref:Tubulointerstitial nephritis antigen like 1 n=1 Tax=Balaenoptera musculus TaxID=9771 RepID=A0A8B8Y8Q9_BALMU|nr:tubulointerstitial nephritis antigen-like isoform X3 [Balaenoptera musculus]
MWRCPLGLLLLLLLAGELALGAQRGRGRRELAPALHLRGIRDAGGRYCQEQDLCCRGRADDCALPYLGATCYCDLFCNRTVSDCCPDFWDFCLGVPPPFPPIQGCMHRGRIYPVLGTYWDNCNRCTCQEKGQWECDQEPCLVDENMIKAINQGNYGWRAGNHSAFWGMTLDEGIRYRLGTIRPSSSVTNMNEIHTVLSPGEVLPRAFEASEKWPNLIHDPLDQGNCAGSWAFSTAAVASDRVSIHSLGHMAPVLSPQNLLSCDTHNQQGCRGGRLDGAWWFLRRRGPHGGARGLLPVPERHLQPYTSEPWEAGAIPPSWDPFGQDHRVGGGDAARRKDAQVLDGGQLVGPSLGREGPLPHRARRQRVRYRELRAGRLGPRGNGGHGSPLRPRAPRREEPPVGQQPPPRPPDGAPGPRGLILARVPLTQRPAWEPRAGEAGGAPRPPSGGWAGPGRGGARPPKPGHPLLRPHHSTPPLYSYSSKIFIFLFTVLK